MTRAVQVRVTGRVQGVFFRAGCADEADRLGVVGWIRNDDDGAVTGHFEGPSAAVEELLAWCRTGPPRAEVRDVRVADAPVEDHAGFHTR